MLGACECGSEPSGSIKYGDCLTSEDMLLSEEGLCCLELVGRSVVGWLFIRIRI